MLLALLLACPQSLTLERGPYLQRLADDRVAVAWRTSQPADSVLLWGSAPGSLANSLADPAPVLEHRLELTGLPADTLFYYAVGAGSQILAGNDANHRFHTAPPRGAAAAVRLWILGDCGTGAPEQLAVRDAFLAWSAPRPPDHVLLLGDNAYGRGTDLEYQTNFFDVYQRILRATPVWSARGNHDEDPLAYDLAFDPPTAGECGGVASGAEAYYSFDVGDAHLVCLDSFASDRTRSGPMMTWLQADLAANQALWTIAFWHHPPYTHGAHNSDDPLDSLGRMRDMREIFLPVLEAAGVDVVLGAHSHSFERSLLLDGHYGDSATFGPQYVLDGGDGRVQGGGAYRKLRGAHSGTVYVVAGNAGQVESGPLDHPALPFAALIPGSVVLDLAPGRLDATLLDAAGGVSDSFTILKRRPPQLDAPQLLAGQLAWLQLTACAPAAPVELALSLTGAGPTQTPFGECALSPPIRPVAAGVADAAGACALGLLIPPGTAGRTVYFQALERSGPGFFSNGLAAIIR